MGTLPLVSIISVNYKQTEVTFQLLESLDKISYKNIEIIIVDNGSEDDFEDQITKRYPQIKFISSAVNLGFAGGNNLGIKQAKGKYLLFLNNDTEVEPQFLEPLVNQLELDPTIGIASPKIIYFDSGNLIQYAGSTGINSYTGRGSKIGHKIQNSVAFDHIMTTQLAHGAAMIVPMKVIQKVGLIPEVFFLYYEEHDWTEMIKRAGYKVLYVGTSTIYHKESLSVGKESALKTYYMTRNRLLFIRRNAIGIKKMASLLFFTFFAIPSNTLRLLLRAKFELLVSFYKGIGWNLVNFKLRDQPLYL